MLMNTKTLTVRFLTPAFLGDVQQRGAWRTPPFKAQLRQWWRLALAARKQWTWERIRAKEAELFGNAWPDQVARKSQVRLRLSEWRPGQKTAWGNGSSQGGSMTIQVGRQTVDAALYLGYGPLGPGRQHNGPQLKYERAIEADEAAELRIAWPAEAAGAEYIEAALALMSRFGAVGGRSRNGWGSYVLGGAAAAVWTDYLLDWRKALESDWVRGIGRDERGPLIWRTRKAYPSWEGAIRALAQVRARVRREVPERCLLAYPDTSRVLPEWGRQERLPNSLRFKVVEDPDGLLRGAVFHLPCRPSDELWEKLTQTDKEQRLRAVWTDAHEYLDEEDALERLSA